MFGVTKTQLLRSPKCTDTCCFISGWRRHLQLFHRRTTRLALCARFGLTAWNFALIGALSFAEQPPKPVLDAKPVCRAANTGQLWPEAADNHYKLALVYTRSGLPDKAKEQLETYKKQMDTLSARPATASPPPGRGQPIQPD